MADIMVTQPTMSKLIFWYPPKEPTGSTSWSICLLDAVVELLRVSNKLTGFVDYVSLLAAIFTSCLHDSCHNPSGRRISFTNRISYFVLNLKNNISNSYICLSLPFSIAAVAVVAL